MILGVTGSRTWAFKELLWKHLDALHEKYGVTLLVHGGALGADFMAKHWAHERGIDTQAFYPNWERGRKAGPERNVQIVSAADKVIAFRWIGKSPGTDHCAAYANRVGKLLYIVRPE